MKSSIYCTILWNKNFKIHSRKFLYWFHNIVKFINNFLMWSIDCRKILANSCSLTLPYTWNASSIASIRPIGLVSIRTCKQNANAYPIKQKLRCKNWEFSPFNCNNHIWQRKPTKNWSTQHLEDCNFPIQIDPSFWILLDWALKLVGLKCWWWFVGF